MDRFKIRVMAQVLVVWLCLGWSIGFAEEAADSAGDTTSTKVKISGQVRFRWFMEDRSQSHASKSQNFGDLRARINVVGTLRSKVRTLIQVQSSRVMGEVDAPPVGNYTETSGSLRKTNELYAHQAYLVLDSLFCDVLSLRAGRFTFDIGNGRVYGSADWDLVGRSFDGAILSVSLRRSVVDVIILKIRDNRTDYGESIYGLRGHIPALGMEPYIMYESDRDRNYGVGALGGKHDILHRTTAGVYHRHGFQEFDWEVQGAYQFGRLYGFADIRAVLLAAQLGSSLHPNSPLRLYAGVDWTTGNKSGNELTERGFSTPYESYEVSHGEFHLFSDYQSSGLSDVFAGGSLRLTPQHELTLSARHFETSEPRRTTGYVLDGSAIVGVKLIGPSTRIGDEFDFRYTWKYESAARVQFVGSLFFPTEYYQGVADPSPIYRVYTTLTVDF